MSTVTTFLTDKDAQLEDKNYALYGSLSSAITDINNNSKENALSSPENAVVRVYTGDSGRLTVALLSDTTETTKLTIRKELDFVLCGNTLTMDGANISLASTSKHIRIFGGINPITGERGKIVRDNILSSVQFINCNNEKSEFIGLDIGVSENVVVETNQLFYCIMTGPSCKTAIFDDCQIKVSKALNSMGIIVYNDTSPTVIMHSSHIVVDSGEGPAYGIHGGLGTPNIIVDSGSSITITHTGTDQVNVYGIYNTNDKSIAGSIQLDDVTVTITSAGGMSYGVAGRGKIRISNSIINAYAPRECAEVACLGCDYGSTSEISNLTAYASTDVLGSSYGIVNLGTMKIKDSTATAIHKGGKTSSLIGTSAMGILNKWILKAKNCTFFGDARGGNIPEEGKEKFPYSNGVQSYGDAYLYDCTVTGTHAGLSNGGASTLFVSGGTYTGNWHGGFYFHQDEGHSAYVHDVVTRDNVYNGEFPETNTINSAYCWGAIYVGGSTGRNNIVVHMDGCTFEGYKHAIAMRGSLGEKNNTVNLSNCFFANRNYEEKPCTINYHNNTHHVNVGVGCNVTEEQIFKAEGQTFDIIDSMMVFTNDLYRKFVPDHVLTGHDLDVWTSFLLGK